MALRDKKGRYTSEGLKEAYSTGERIHHFKGKKQSKATIEKRRNTILKNPEKMDRWSGRKQPKSMTAKRSESLKKAYKEGRRKSFIPAGWNKGIFGKDSHSYGHKVSQEARERIRSSMVNRPVYIQDTSIEVKLQNALAEKGIMFEKQKPVANISRVDIFIAPNICVYADGCYWHACQQCLSQERVIERHRRKKIIDLAVTQKLQDAGYIVLRFWEHQINADVQTVVETIQNRLQEIYNGR